MKGGKKTVKNGDHAPLSGFVKWPVWSPFEGASERALNAFMPYGKNLWSNMIITCKLIKFSRIKSTYTQFVIHAFQQQAQLNSAMTS